MHICLSPCSAIVSVREIYVMSKKIHINPRYTFASCKSEWWIDGIQRQGRQILSGDLIRRPQGQTIRGIIATRAFSRLVPPIPPSPLLCVPVVTRADTHLTLPIVRNPLRRTHAHEGGNPEVSPCDYFMDTGPLGSVRQKGERGRRRGRRLVKRKEASSRLKVGRRHENKRNFVTGQLHSAVDISQNCHIVAVRKYFIALNKKKKNLIYLWRLDSSLCTTTVVIISCFFEIRRAERSLMKLILSQLEYTHIPWKRNCFACHKRHVVQIDLIAYYIRPE